MVSRRAGRTFSDLAEALGVHRIRTVPARGHYATRGDRPVWVAVLAFSVLLLASILRGGLASCGEERGQQQMADGAAAGVVVEHC